MYVNKKKFEGLVDMYINKKKFEGPYLPNSPIPLSEKSAGGGEGGKGDRKPGQERGG